MDQALTIADEVPDTNRLERKMKELGKVLEIIPDSDKKILLMKFQENMSIKEIALTLNKSESAVKMKIKRAKAKARDMRLKLFPEN